MSELLSAPETITPLSEVELQHFADICLTPTGERSEPSILSLVASCHYDIQRAPFGGMGPNWPRVTARNTAIWGTTPLESIYNAALPDEYAVIVAHDIAGWNKLYKMTYELSPGQPDNTTRLFEPDRHRALTYVLPHSKTESKELINAYAFPEVYISEFNTMPQLVERLENGMPREVQLLCIALTLPGLIKSDSDMLGYDAFRTSILCREFEVCPRELATVYDVMEAAFPERVTHLRMAILQSKELQSLLGTEQCSTRDWLQQNPKVLKDALKLIFSDLIQHRTSDYIQSWQNACSLLGDESTKAHFTTYERTMVLHSAVLKNLLDPHCVALEVHPELACYIDAPKLAAECGAMLKSTLANPPKPRGASPAAVAHEFEDTLGIDLKHEVLLYGEYPYCKQLDAVIRYAGEDTTLYKDATSKRAETFQYDPLMRQMLSQYAKLRNDESLRRLGQGYSYDDDPEWFDAREVRQQAVKSRLKVLESLITKRATLI